MTSSVSYCKLNFFSRLIQSYLAENKEAECLYSTFPTWENFSKQIALKSFQKVDRDLLANRLLEQYNEIKSKKATLKNIELVRAENTFTITTGHQLNLFTGPLYFVYKIISTLKLTQQLQEKYPDFHFVPVYWMATEDHDFQEINHFYTDVNQKITWNFPAKGAVGRLKTDDLESAFQDLSNALGEDPFAIELKTLFKEAYGKRHSLSFATKVMVHSLFGQYGLVILDADDAVFKKQFAPYIQTELTQQVVYNQVTKTNAVLKQNHWEVQVNPREINLFYLKDALRERIVLEGGIYKILNTDMVFTEEAILQELQNHPERFSPNVLLRPVYQEVVLPNLAYIGGAAEVAYWLQLKEAFESFQMPFPMLILRNSALWVKEKNHLKWEKLGLSTVDYFEDREAISKKIVCQHQEIPQLDFNTLAEQLTQDVQPITEWLEQIEPTLVPSVRATMQKQLNEWTIWEQKLQKILKKKHTDQIERALQLVAFLYPQGILQERYLNFSYVYQKTGTEMFERLLETFDPLAFEFNVLEF